MNGTRSETPDCSTCWQRKTCPIPQPATYCQEYRHEDAKPPKREPIAPDDETEGGKWA